MPIVSCSLTNPNHSLSRAQQAADTTRTCPRYTKASEHAPNPHGCPTTVLTTANILQTDRYHALPGPKINSRPIYLEHQCNHTQGYLLTSPGMMLAARTLPLAAVSARHQLSP